ncbi:MAG: ribose ABC transporter permease [Pelagibacteraceae bacterium]|jgi:ribose/xylose/arabinose/galactoside ABC-type transport system permease subunit|nr:ribose ABC transporter permease [Pelagibacteraceae bacterium]|tara:strand:+ start:671 stop:1645 length:975 start_codon:yes stop_codon:yes gene_type:complete
MQKKTGLVSYLSDNSRPLSSFFYFALIMTIFFAAAPEVFFAAKFHQAVMTTLPIIIFLVIPLVFIVTMGEIDLSFASIFGFAAWIFAGSIKYFGFDPFLGLLVGIAGGAALGIFMGCLVVYGRISSLVASLGALFLIRGFLFVVSDSKSITIIEIRDHWMYPLLVGKFYGFPMQLFWAALFVIISYFLYHRHVFGAHVHHVGDNPDSAAQMGVNVDLTRIYCFMFCGIGAGIAGIFSTLINFTWWPTQGFGFLLLAIAGVFVGGTPTWGGVGTILGAVFGSGVIAYMETGIVAMGWSGLWRQFFNGLIIILALLGHRFHGNRIR